jgi:hypothetical protein
MAIAYTPKKMGSIAGATPVSGVTIAAPSLGRQWLIDLMTISVGSPGAGNFNCLVWLSDDVQRPNPTVVLADVRVPASFGLTLPLIGGGVFQQYTIADPNAAILQPMRRREHLTYPQGIVFSLLNGVPAGVNWSASYRYMELQIGENFCFPEV